MRSRAARAAGVSPSGSDAARVVSCACDRRWISAGFGHGCGARPARKRQGVGTAGRTENDGAVKVLPCWVRHQISCGLLRKRERGDCKQGKDVRTAGKPFLGSVGKIKTEGKALSFLPWTWRIGIVYLPLLSPGGLDFPRKYPMN